MKISKILNIILGILLIISIIYIINLKKVKTSQNKDNQTNIENNIDNTEQDNNNKLEYDCSFTRTYHIVNKLDGYIAEVPELSYVVLDQYQAHGAFTHIIPSKLKNNLEVDKNYEFTYTLKGTGIIENIDDVYKYLSATTVNKNQKNETITDLSVELSIKETDKLGMEQLQEPICK